MKIILGSSSKYRKRVLEENGYKFGIMIPDIDEKKIRTEDPYELPLMIAEAKAAALIPKIPDPALLITSDQIVVCDRQVYEKPQTEEEARSFLQKYSSGYPRQRHWLAHRSS
ncbi:Maf family protein [Candidatus Kaiserbacteria bacterium]|nr:Maf family protein [Candidatus Kaiserbacteria bacterium]